MIFPFLIPFLGRLAGQAEELRAQLRRMSLEGGGVDNPDMQFLEPDMTQSMTTLSPFEGDSGLMKTTKATETKPKSSGAPKPGSTAAVSKRETNPAETAANDGGEETQQLNDELADLMADEAWVEKRKVGAPCVVEQFECTRLLFCDMQELMEAENAIRKVLIFGYMRGGTSILSEVFNQDTRAQAWYEPLGAIYGHMFGLPQFRSYSKIVFSDKKNVVYR
jgi:hypothetical protein